MEMRVLHGSSMDFFGLQVFEIGHQRMVSGREVEEVVMLIVAFKSVIRNDLGSRLRQESGK